MNYTNNDCDCTSIHSFYCSIDIYKKTILIRKKCLNCDYNVIFNDTCFYHSVIPYIENAFMHGEVVNVQSVLGCDRSHKVVPNEFRPSREVAPTEICLECQIEDTQTLIYKNIDFIY